MLTTMTA